jgi:hypothetical protein
MRIEMRQHYKPEPRRRPLWDILTALLLGIWFAIFAAAYFEILWKERIDSFPEDKIITCTVFMIEATKAGCGGIVKSL